MEEKVDLLSSYFPDRDSFLFYDRFVVFPRRDPYLARQLPAHVPERRGPLINKESINGGLHGIPKESEPTSVQGSTMIIVVCGKIQFQRLSQQIGVMLYLRARVPRQVDKARSDPFAEFRRANFEPIKMPDIPRDLLCSSPPSQEATCSSRSCPRPKKRVSTAFFQAHQRLTKYLSKSSSTLSVPRFKRNRVCTLQLEKKGGRGGDLVGGRIFCNESRLSRARDRLVTVHRGFFNFCNCARGDLDGEEGKEGGGPLDHDRDSSSPASYLLWPR
ncbi:hypothetical protein K0M31_005063 [Melipona bicolor]|uniref:Uncharacterized protein n=1 Tax=Melipona bicolor TaxID=60889 RepID=A0AA40FWJ9_9HYME|nr:hypothetical protein K0M31_005063 [Melipona bicolor]